MKFPQLLEIPGPERDLACKIGDFYVGPATDGAYWIEHESGEGMHVSKKAMEKMIADFYKENF